MSSRFLTQLTAQEVRSLVVFDEDGVYFLRRNEIWENGHEAFSSGMRIKLESLFGPDFGFAFKDFPDTQTMTQCRFNVFRRRINEDGSPGLYIADGSIMIMAVRGSAIENSTMNIYLNDSNSRGIKSFMDFLMKIRAV